MAVTVICRHVSMLRVRGRGMQCRVIKASSIDPPGLHEKDRVTAGTDKGRSASDKKMDDESQ